MAIAQLKVPRNVVAILAIAENAIGKDAYKPYSTTLYQRYCNPNLVCSNPHHRYDIIRSHKGLSVRVNNTDAEGRLALADALSYGQQCYNPSTIIDVATLTGAIVVALGEHAAGLFSNNEALEGTLRSVGKEVHERVWVL